MAIVGGLDVHRKQITFDYLDTSTGEVRRGRVPGTRLAFRDWLGRLDVRPAAFAVEGCTGWRFVVEELRRAGMDAHLAEPADTRALRGPKRHAKTDGIDARHLRELLQAGTLPESWIPPEQVREMRTRVRLYKDLVDERTTWQQRIQALLFHHGVNLGGELLVSARRRQLEAEEGLSPAAREAVAVALRQIDRLAAELQPLRQAFHRFAQQQPGCRALTQEYGIGSLLGVAILGGTGRLPALLVLGRCCPAQRDRHHRALVGWQGRPRSSLPPGSAPAALGALRSRPVRRPSHLARPGLLWPGEGAIGGQPRGALAGAQARPSGSPPAPGAGRRRPGRRGLMFHAGAPCPLSDGGFPCGPLLPPLAAPPTCGSATQE